MKAGNNTIKKLVDVCMTVLLLCLMAYQVTGEMLHEWFGVGMTLALIVHHILKTIIPFCSHGGGRFGQSLTAIAKLAPNSVMGEGLSVHYSGGASLPDDVSAWLDENGIARK